MAGSGRRVFTPGEVLSASNVMNYLQDQVVMNFAGTAARGSAIGTAVSEGMVSYLADSNVVQAYDGSAWNSLVYQSELPRVGLKPIIPSSVTVSSGSGSYNSTTGEITFSGVTAIQINGVFSSSYKNYRAVINVPVFSASSGVALRFRTGTTDNSTNNYYQYWLSSRLTGSVTTNSGGPNTFHSIFPATVSSNGFFSYSADIYQPYVSDVTTHITGIGMANDATSSQTILSSVLFNVNASFDGISFFPSGGGHTMGGTIKIYGYN